MNEPPKKEPTEHRTKGGEEITPLDGASDAEAPTRAAPPRATPQQTPSVAAGTTFRPGEVVAERYRIVRFLAAGGMGEVYEAEDTELREQVALKTIRPEIVNNPRTLERFRREIHLAHQITHPNACRIFDLSRHTREDGGEVVFLTMELLAGDTLAQRIRTRGPIPAAEALPIVRQMVAALEAAHAVGVVHRDFKCGNVVLVPGRSDGEERVVVADFGMAQGDISKDSFATSMTEGGAIVGTPAYMAPEQVAGEEVNPAADIYALGVVLYEMLTQRLPFEGETAFSVAVKRLTEKPVPPSERWPSLDPRWEQVILRCLERWPAKRYDSVGAVVRALAGESHVLTPLEVRRKRWRRIALVTVVSALAALLFFQLGRRAPAPVPIEIAAERPAPPETLRRSVAVLGFKNLAGRDEMSWVSTTVAELLGTQLGEGKELRILPGEAVTQAKIELELPETDSLASATLEKVRRNLGADVVVIGSYLALGPKGRGTLSLSVRAQDTVSGEMLGLIAEEGELGEIFTLVGTVASKLGSELGVGGATAQAAATTRATFPADPEAARLYAGGLDRLRHFDALAAKEMLQSAVAAAPEHPMAYLALSEAWGKLGYDARARETAEAAFERVAGQGLRVRLTVEARLRELEGAWEQAAGLYRTLWTEAPDEVEHALKLAEVEVAGGKPEAALGTVTALRRLPKPASADPRIDLAEAAAAELAADYERELRAAARATEKGQARQAPLLTASAKLYEAKARWKQSAYEPAMAAAEAARALWKKAGDRGGEAQALILIGNIRREQGDPTGAIERYEQSLAIRREIGDRRGEASALHNIAIVQFEQGNSSGALERYEKTLDVFREIGDRQSEARALHNLANVLVQQGDLSGALERFEQSMAIRRETGDRQGEGFTLNNIGAVLYYMGEFEGARQRYEASIAIRREIGDRRGVAESLGNIAGVVLKKGDISGAHERYEEALALSREIGDRRGEALALINLGELFLIRAEPSRAADRQNEALRISREIGSKWYESIALFLLAEVLLATDRLAEADVRHRKAQDLREEIGAATAVLTSRLARAALALDAGRSGEALAAARELAETYRGTQDTDGEALAEALEARSLLARGMEPEAAAAAERAATLAAKSQDLQFRLGVEVTTLRVRSLAGTSHTTGERLAEIAAEAEEKGAMALALEARLALGEVEIAAGESAGRKRLEKLAKEAEKRGMMLLARKAREVIAAP
jgi:tetratricopeptide (TPR) repeat protein